MTDAADEAKAKKQAIAEKERARRSAPATTGDIERLIEAVNSGWIGRGFAIGFGMVVLGFIAGILFGMFWIAVVGSGSL